MTSLTLYPTSTASSITGDNTLSTSAPNAETSTTSKVGTTAATYWAVLYSLGNTSITTSASEIAPADHGWLYDSTALEGQTLLPGTWTFKAKSVNSTTGCTITADIHCIISKRTSGGGLTPILDAVLSGQSITHAAATYTVTGTTTYGTMFNTGDKLHYEVQLKVTSTSSTASTTTISIFENLSTNDSIVSPGYLPTPSTLNSYKQNVLNDSPVRYYHLNETVGTTATDSSVNAQNGTINGSVTYNVTSLLQNDNGTAITFDGSTGYISVPTTSLPSGSHAMSLESWVRYASVPIAYRVILEMGTDTSNEAMTLQNNASGDLEIAVNGVVEVINSSAVATGTNYHCLATYDGNVLTLYINGQNAGSSTIGATTITYGVANIAINANFSGSVAFPGTIGHAAIYNAALSSTQAQNHYLLAVIALRAIPATVALVATKTRTITSTSALLATKTRTISSTVALKGTKTRTISSTVALKGTSTRAITATVALVATKTRTITSTVALKGTSTRTITSTSALVSTKTRTITSTVALKGTSTRTITATVALVATKTRTVPASSSLLATKTRTITATVALVATKTRTISAQSTLLATFARTVSTQSALLATKTRTIAASSSLLATKTRTISASSALLTTKTISISATASLLATLARVIPATATLSGGGPTTSTRTIPDTVALLATATRTIPVTSALLATTTRTIPSTSALMATATRTIPVTSALLATTTRTIPVTGALLATTTRTIPDTSALLATTTRTIPDTAALLATTTRTIPVTAALLATKSRVLSVTVAFLAAKSRTVPTIGALFATKTRTISDTVTLIAIQTRAIAPTATLLATSARIISVKVAMLAIQTRAIAPTTALLATKTRTISSSTSLLAIQTRNIHASTVLAAIKIQTIPCSTSLSVARFVICTACLLATRTHTIPITAALIVPNAILFVRNGTGTYITRSGTGEVETHNTVAISFARSGQSTIVVQDSQTIVHTR